ncbi:hypothetical protein EU383_16870 [Salmonella enterica subsp. enterica serovar Napoli]|uniref:Uncharacterized protein n=1 Tax=Salmonella enterica subsp. enterica serovar Napoli TaxID=1151001 RepID=A0A5J2K9N1_SALET|nr:hypothetical protein [Salmonella enterica subsp. enterica serovar Napoli]EAW0368692.1 hypothetical protein [Salmonella enterica]EBN0191406.1 hypothetical protein [Salmonella enterica subsp. enterica serovar Enteritidis]EDS6568568.1 hypothetical protein [Salmonella enterica subsp. enterica]EAX5132600.1 hypothetical protein [Salmonella enterica]
MEIDNNICENALRCVALAPSSPSTLRLS